MNPAGAELEPKERDRIFQERILPALNWGQGSKPLNPVAAIVGGQPGSGKSPLLAVVRDDVAKAGKTWVINGDDFYSYHPKHHALVEKHGSIAALEMMKGEAGHWVKMALAEAQKRGVNIVMETTMRQPELVQAQAKQFKANGYTVSATVMAVPEQESWANNRLRYEMISDLGYPARLTPREVHDEAFVNLPKTVDALERSKAVDSLTVVKRGGGADSVLYSNALTQGEWQKAPAAGLVIEAERRREWPQQRVDAYSKQWDRIQKFAVERVSGSEDGGRAELARIASERTRAEKQVVWRNQDRALAKIPLQRSVEKIPDKSR